MAGKDVAQWPMPRRPRIGLGRSFQITCIVPGFTALGERGTRGQARAGSSFRLFRSVRLGSRDAARRLGRDIGQGPLGLVRHVRGTGSDAGGPRRQPTHLRGSR